MRSYENVNSPKDIAGLNTMSKMYSNYKIKAADLKEQMLREEKKNGHVNHNTHIKYIEAVKLSKQFKAGYDAGYHLLKALKENPRNGYAENLKVTTFGDELSALRNLVDGLQEQLNESNEELAKKEKELMSYKHKVELVKRML